MKSTVDFFPVIKTSLVGITKNGKDKPEHCCRSELMDREMLQIKYFLRLRPSVKASN